MTRLNQDWINYKQKRNQVVNIIRYEKSQYYKKNVDLCKGDSKKMWRTLQELIGGKRGRASSQEISNLTFPDTFLFGAASSAYQVEGAWNESGKGPSRWDYLVHTIPVITGGSTGDVASDSYHKYEEDIAVLKELGVNFYRFSISWPRLLPTGFINEINPAGVEYYNNLINGLLAEGIEPWVTMYHWDIPLPVHYLGSWNNDKIIEYFTEYADLLFRLFGDRVKTWLTINEPLTFCVTVTIIDIYILGQAGVPTGITEYKCAHNVLRAHAKVYRLYQLKYKAKQRGRISIVLNTEFPLPGSDTPEDIEAANRKRDFDLGWYLHPLVYGNYPQTMIDTIASQSAAQGYPVSRLPKFTLLESLEILGAYDFIALNHYSSVLTTSDNSSEISPASFDSDDNVLIYQDPSWGGSAVSWLKVAPEGFRALLTYIKEKYRNPEIAITEQGYADLPDTVIDIERINYYQLYLSAALNAIYEDGVRLFAYTAWSLLDSFEWNSGYSIRFGLYHIDFEDENRTRTPKESAGYYKNVIATRCLVDTCV
ncbi:myrosinase 1 [Anoplophora glabripennis]|uniref:myrosinase 1 n=1 Tax=Anoplophora glabripennis TaxID=217634 RepID=UPI000874DE4C|nr:myrosinase 1 [Anoplophora glabripennis]